MAEDVEGEQSTLVFDQFVVGKADDDEEDGEDGETHELDGLSADGIHGGDGDPITRNGTGQSDDEVANGGVVEDMIHILAAGVADRGEDDGVVETETVESDIQEEPRTGGADEDFGMLPLAVMMGKVGPAGLGSVQSNARILQDGGPIDLVWMTFPLALHVSLDIFAALFDVTGNIEGIAGGFRNGEAEVEGNAAGNGAKANDDSPHLVDGQSANTTALARGFPGHERFLEATGDDESDDGGRELADALHGEDGTHHRTTPFGGGEFGGDDGGQGVIASNANAHHHAPEDDDAHDGHRRRVGGERLGEGGEDDQDQLQAVHAFATDEVGQPAKADLADDGTARSGDLDGGIGGGRDGAGLALGAMPVHDAQHGGDEVDGEDVVRIGEEADAGDDDRADMVPAEGRLVDLGEGQSSPLIGIGDVGEVIVEVVKGNIAAGCFTRHLAEVAVCPIKTDQDEADDGGGGGARKVESGGRGWMAGRGGGACEKQRSREAAKQRSSEAEKQRSREAAKSRGRS